jgi:protein-S-isoprenylcysteine O-methyltransferase Ste14
VAAGYLRKNQVLAAAGPYRFVRNPFYVADFLRDLGVLLACNGTLGARGLVGFAIGALYFVLMFGVVIRRRVKYKEEPELRRTFGAAYDAFCAQVPRFFPRLTPAPTIGDSRFSWQTLAHNREAPRLIAMLVLIPLTYYRNLAWGSPDLPLARILDDRWDLALVALLPSLLLYTKVRYDALDEAFAARLARAIPWVLAAWVGLLLWVDGGPEGEQVLAWSAGLVLVAAGICLQRAARADLARRPGSGVYGIVRHPSALAAVLVMSGLASCAGALWLVPATGCLTASLMAPWVRVQESAHAQRLGSGYPPYRDSVPAMFPRPGAVPALLRAVGGSFSAGGNATDLIAAAALAALAARQWLFV